MRLIETLDDVAEGLDALARADRRLVAVIETAGPVPLRRQPAGFEGLARIVVAQQISVAAAASIWGRLEAGLGTVTPETFAACPDEIARSYGLSRGKAKTLKAAAEAALDGRIDFAALSAVSVDEAHAALTPLPGIGPWTADIFLLFCAGHPDVWPGGDLALAAALHHAFGLDARPDARASVAIAEAWAPWRGVAARLFWAYYGAVKAKGGFDPV